MDEQTDLMVTLHNIFEKRNIVNWPKSKAYREIEHVNEIHNE